MIVLKSGSIFDDNPADTLICPIDISDNMDKGLAAEFKKHYPYLYEQYVNILNEMQFSLGDPWMAFDINDKNIILLPIANGLEGGAAIDWIEKGFIFIRSIINVCKSIAFPLIGNNQSDKFTIIELIQKYFGIAGEIHWLYIEECQNL